MTSIRLTVSSIIASGIVLAGVAAGDELEVGKPFPDLVLPSLDGGEPVSLADFRGHKVVLHVFASW